MYIDFSFAQVDAITKGSIFIFLLFSKIGWENTNVRSAWMLLRGIMEAQLSVNSNFIANELSLFSQKDRKPICFFIIMCCFLGGVSATNYKNIFRCSTVQPGSFSHKSWIMLALCPVHGSSTPRCVYTSHVSSAEFCDSNVVLRGVSLWGFWTVKSFSWESCVGVKLSFPYTNSISAFDSLFFFTSQLPAHPLGRPCGLVLRHC